MGLTNSLAAQITVQRRAAADRLSFMVIESEHHESIAEVVLEGLSQDQKRLPCRFFYDEVGSQLFEQICDLPEYYLTRTEEDVLLQFSREIIQHAGEPTTIVEFGSGNSRKTRILLESTLDCHTNIHYVPIDISGEMLRQSSDELLERYANLSISAICAEYEAA